MAIGGVLFDIDGVLVTSWQAIAGAAEALQTLADRRDSAVLPDQHHHPHPPADRVDNDRRGHGRPSRRSDHRCGADRRLCEDQIPGGPVFPGQQRDIADDMPGIDVSSIRPERRT